VKFIEVKIGKNFGNLEMKKIRFFADFGILFLLVTDCKSAMLGY
jgi:hypothetical protein